MRPNQPVEFPHPPEIREKLLKKARGYDWPAFGHDAEMKSLVYHSQLRQGLRSDAPPEAESRLIMSRLEQEYSAARWSIPSDFITFEHFLRVVGEVDMTSSPGYPYMRRYTNNSQFFQAKCGQFDQGRLAEIYELVLLQIRERRCDPIRLFIKPEPHKESKLANRRYRLISSVSVVDQIIDALLFGSFNSAVNENCLRVPCKGGWSPYGGGWKIVPPSGTMSLDKSGWDWSAHMWLFDMELRLRTRLCDNLTAQWLDLATWRYNMLFRQPEFITSGGLRLKQKSSGVMKSGCYNTLVTNSIMQSLIHLRVCCEMDMTPGWMWTLGDDTLQQAIDDRKLRKEYLERCAQYCHVKHCVDGAEFAGMRFMGPRVEPLYRGKHSYKLLHLREADAGQTSSSYQLLYHRSEYKRSLEALLPVLKETKETLDAIWDDW